MSASASRQDSRRYRLCGDLVWPPVARRGTCASTASPWNTRQGCNASGAPGSGKTSLAVPLAAALGYALLAKDRIKETLHDAFGAPGPDRAWSRRLGGAAMELLWALAADAPAVVIEANFRPRSEYERAKLSGLAARARRGALCLPARTRSPAV